jgi:hypothetical protein
MFRTLACLLLASVASSAVAQETTTTTRVVEGDVLLIDRVQRTHGQATLPRRGLLMSQVEAQYGAPTQKLPAVGGGNPQRPPITRWIYPEFTVYFEHSHVVNAVVNRAGPMEKGPKPARDQNG